jgi:hypothetical protein
MREEELDLNVVLNIFSFKSQIDKFFIFLFCYQLITRAL